jgi:hypothetical protein
MRDRDPLVRETIVYALAEIGSESAVEVLFALRANRRHRRTATFAIRRLVSPRAVPALERVASGARDAEDRRIAARVLCQIRPMPADSAEERIVAEGQTGDSAIVRSGSSGLGGPVGGNWTYSISYHGEAQVPVKVYQNDSKPITILLRPAAISGTSVEPTLASGGDSLFEFHTTRDLRRDEFLEVELLASGAVVDGESKQREMLDFRPLSFRWSCYFPNSGRHHVGFTFRLINESGTSVVGDVIREVLVVRIDHLTQRQVLLLAASGGIVSAAYTVFQILAAFGILTP